MQSMIPAVGIACGALCAFSPAQQAAPVVQTNQAATASNQQTEEQERAKLLGVLVYTNVTVKFEDTPVRDAINALKKALGIQIIGRYSDDSVGFGIDPTLPITLDAQQKDALSVLEEVLDQCEVYEDCTWQLRKGYVEVSTKERLSVPSAREVRLYHIRDFMLEPPRFESEHDTQVGFAKAPYASAALASRTGTLYANRKRPEDLALEIVAAIVETVEPGNWDYGNQLDPDRSLEKSTSSSGGSQASAPPRSQAGVGTWASIRLWRDQLIIKAPDFMHRQINGYPAPIRPEGRPTSEQQPVKAQQPAPGGAASTPASGSSPPPASPSRP